MLYRLREQGFSVHGFEQGDGVGGTWYWNRYPGARCDSEIMYYSFSFMPDLEQEWPLEERYPGQPEILRYLEHVADRLDLRQDFTFGARVIAVEYNEAENLWTLRTEQGHTATARFVITAVGCLSTANMPEFKGADSFAGLSLHTGMWPRKPVDFTGKRVGVIGTGASGIQAIPVIAEQAAELTVFQRTAQFTIPAENGPLDPQFVELWKQNYREWRRRGRESTGGIPYPRSTLSALEVPETSAGPSTRPPGAPAVLVHLRHLRGRGAERGGEQDRGRVRLVQDRPDRRRPRGRGHAQAEDLPVRHQARAAGHELLRHLQPAERDPGGPAAHPAEEITATGHQDQRR